MKTRDVLPAQSRQVHSIRERDRDPYKLTGKLREPAHCTQCGAVYRKGRWVWSDEMPAKSGGILCQACHRINDDAAAGEVLVHGTFAASHRGDILNLARNIERDENAQHPLHRILRTEEVGDVLRITTTDIHLPHAIGHALRDAWDGELKTHYDVDGYYARVDWVR